MSDANDVAIKVSGVSKAFKLPHEKKTSVKSLFVGMLQRHKNFEIQQALNNIDFNIQKGEFFGVIGRNGSGKSTLLKLLAGIYTPDKGHIEVNGKLTPFIELGVGFNPELTGRENVFLNGALLGFNRKEMEVMYDEIVDFAELHKFMDQKLKNYSSGMQVRLAFSIAVRAKSEILLLDEVLAVGDISFQEKCFNYFKEIKKEKQTVVFVSHDFSSVEKFCDRVAVIDQSRLVDIGPPEKMVAILSTIMGSDQTTKEDLKRVSNEEGTGEVAIQSFSLRAKDGSTAKAIASGDEITVNASYKSKLPSGTKVIVGVSINDSEGQVIYGPNTSERKSPVTLSRQGSIQLKIKSCTLVPGSYTLTIGVFNHKAPIAYSLKQHIASFRIIGKQKHGIVDFDAEWKIS